ncbi:hypothetical protein [Mariniblastus fucicola]|nr:hypothetical protein [Mariniblastus fucicola]
MADTTEGQHAMSCISDDSGQIYWIESSQLVVESVDGKSTHELLS